MSARSPSASTRSPCLEKCRNSLCDVGTVGGYTGRSRDTSRTGFRHCAGLLLRFRLHGDFRLFDAGFLFRALRNLFLCAALGLFALLFQSLHFLLAFLECNGHKNLLKFTLQSVTAVNLPRTLPAGFPRLAGSFPVVFVLKTLAVSATVSAPVLQSRRPPGFFSACLRSLPNS